MLDRFHVPDDIAVRVPPPLMKATVTSIFEALGSPPDDAERCAETLLYADRRGIDTHGVSNMMRVYVAGIRGGAINPAPKWRIVREAEATATIDSDEGLGLTVGPQAMDLAIEKARKCGIGSVAVMNGRHFGAAAFHAHRAVPHDMIGVATTVGGKQVAPTFGAEALIGLNPIGVAVPAREEAPFVFDASMSSVAGNKIRLARRLGANVLPAWIAEADGTPIMDERPVPDEFMMLPVGGTREIGSHKGYSLAIVVDVLSGVLSGTGPGFATRMGNGHHFLAYRVDAFTDLDQFKDDMDLYLRTIRESKTAPDHERVYYAGLNASEKEEERAELGIPYHPEVIGWFHEVLGELGVPDELPAV